MKTKYRTNMFKDNIELKEFDITKETDAYFWVGIKKYKKRSVLECYFDTFEEALKYLLEEADKRKEEYEKQVKLYSELSSKVDQTISKIKDLKPF